MQGVYFNDRNIQFFLRRKHKLHKALALPSDHPPPSPQDQHHILQLYHSLLNRDNQISQLDYFIKHEFHCSLPAYIDKLLPIIWELLAVRSGTLLAFVVYRLCRKHPSIYWKVYEFAKICFLEKSSSQLQETKFLTDLYLYGLPFTLQEFATFIFPRFEPEILDLLPRYKEILESHLFFPPKYQKSFMNHLHEWMQKEKTRVEIILKELRETADSIQKKMVVEKEDEAESADYQKKLEVYEALVHRFANAMEYLDEEIDMAEYRMKSVFELKKECSTFKKTFSLSEYEESLYLKINPDCKKLKPFKKSQMLKIEQNDYFLTQTKICSNITECYNLSGYFIEQMNLQTNRQKLIQIIINDCYSYNNIAYIIKILFEIGQVQPSIKDYCATKGKKICGQARMNQKYQKLLCEMTKFELIDEDILLQYCDKILKNENNQVTKQIESIFEQLGTIVYYRSLKTHVKINSIYHKMESIIKNKSMHFSLDNLFNLKSVMNYLRNPTNQQSISNSQAHEMAKLEIKTNYQFIFKKMDRLQRENKIDKVLEYLLEGIDNEEYLTSYFYASLVKDIKNKELDRHLHRSTLDIIKNSIEAGNGQKSVRWARFLGQLYNYESINRRMIVDDLTDLLKQYQKRQDIEAVLKSISAAIQTGKNYLRDSQYEKDRKDVIYLLLELKKILNEHKHKMDPCTSSEIEDILEFFHSALIHQLQDNADIDDLLDLEKQYQYKKSIYYFLDQIGKGITIQELKALRAPEAKRKYREKDDKPAKYMPKQKKKETKQDLPKYVQKVEKIEKEKDQLTNTTQIEQSNHQTKSEPFDPERREQPAPATRKVKVMGRSRGDKTIKTISCNFIESTSKE